MREEAVLALVNDVFDLPYGQIELFCEALIGQAVQQPALYNSTVSFREYPFVNQVLDLAAGKINAFCASCRATYHFASSPFLFVS